MSEPFIAEIRIFAGNFAPRGWAFCNGQLLPISQNTALFSLIGTTYGGDGRTTTALPNLQGRAPMHPGNGPGLSARRLGETGGTEAVTLSEGQVPNQGHRHDLLAQDAVASETTPEGNVLAGAEAQVYGGDTPLGQMAATALEPVTLGAGQPHNNMQPFLAINFIIALVGLFPSRS